MAGIIIDDQEGTYTVMSGFNVAVAGPLGKGLSVPADAMGSALKDYERKKRREDQEKWNATHRLGFFVPNRSGLFIPLPKPVEKFLKRQSLRSLY